MGGGSRSIASRGCGFPYRLEAERLGLQRPIRQRDRPIAAGGRAASCRRCRAHDVLFDHHVARTADDKQMLHIVAANED